MAKAAGNLNSFDSKYRSTGWIDLSTARSIMESFLRITDIELTTFDDDEQVFGTKNVTACADYLHDLEVREVAVKMGERGCMTFSPEHQVMTATTPHKPFDTTKPSGSFNLT